MATLHTINIETVLAVHTAQIAEHGGLKGVRDEGLLASALDRAHNLMAYENPTIAQFAAIYGHGLCKNHPFNDGKKRTAFVCTELALMINGWTLIADDVSCVQIMLALAAGDITEAQFAGWLEKNSQPDTPD